MLLIGVPGGGKDLKDLRMAFPAAGRRGLVSGRKTAGTEKPVGYGRLIFLALCVILLPGGSHAQDNPDRALRLCLGEAADTLEALTVTPQEDGAVFRSAAGDGFVLADVLVRRKPDPGAAPLAAAAGEDRYLAYRAGPENRWGLSPAWVVGERDGRRFLVQQALIASGTAMAAPDRGAPDCAGALKWSEAVARQAGLGLWQDERVLSTRTPAALLERAGHYVVAVGRIVSLGKTSRTRYLNFGFRWKSDFTATLRVSEEDAFDAVLADKGVRIADLAGAAVLVRGVIQVRDGPYMELVHPGQLDVIEVRKGEE